MRLLERFAHLIAPGLMNTDQVGSLVAEEVKRARMSLPISANYDPKGEGYRRLGSGDTMRELAGLSQGRMFEVAYFMMDSSAMTKRLAKMDKSFLFAEPITVDSDDDNVQEILDRLWTDAFRKIEFPNLMMWLSVLGEQCWPVDVNPANGAIEIFYADPAIIKDVHVFAKNVKQPVRVDFMGSGGRPGKKMPIIRKDKNSLSQTFGRLVGEGFFWAINHPPNAVRGRSDFLTLFDWIDALERYGYNYLERAEFLLNFIWDITLKGMNEEEIRQWLKDNPAPEPGSQRAHNEQVEWQAVSPDLKAADFTQGFDMGKGFVMGAAGRPDSWFGSGGKAYQTEAEQFGQVPIKDLDERQVLIGTIAEDITQFAVDQAVIAGRLSEKQAEAGFTVNLPEISKKNLANAMNAVPQFTTAMTLAENQGWLRKETAARLFALVAGQMGFEYNVDDELKEAAPKPDEGTEDYFKTGARPDTGDEE